MSDVLDLLRSLEWCMAGDRCPACHMSLYGMGHASSCPLALAIRALTPPEPSPAEPSVGEMAREMGLGPVTYTDDQVRTLYREHKARQIADTVHPALFSCGRPDCHIDTPHGHVTIDPASPMLGSHEKPPTDPVALAAWLYARVVPGRTIAESPGRRFVVLAVDMSADGQRVFVDEANGYAIPRLRQAPITRLLNPDGTVLWEAM